MGIFIGLHAELGNGNAIAVADMVEASRDRDATNLRRFLVAGGVGEGTTTLYLALFKSPAGLFLRTKFLFYPYYGVLAAIVLFGATKVWTGLWVSRDPFNRRAIGMTVLWVSVVPVLFLAGVGGFATLK